MPTIDPGTGIDLDLPYDDPAMAAIREQLLASGKQLHGSRLADGDMRAVASQAMQSQGQRGHRATNAMSEAMTQDPGLWDSVAQKYGPKLSQNAPETYERILGERNERNSSVPQAQMRNEPPASAPDSTEGAQGLPPLEGPPNAIAPNPNAQGAEGMGPWGPLLTLILGLATGGAVVKGGQAVNWLMRPRGAAAIPPGPRNAIPGDLDAGPGLRGAVSEDIMGPQPRQMVADDVMQMFAPRDAVDADFAPTTPIQRAQPQVTPAQGRPVKPTPAKPAAKKPEPKKPEAKSAPPAKKGKGKADIARVLAKRGRK
jgi:hypothetical protein